MWPWAQSWRKRVDNGEMGGAGRSQSMWDFADHGKDVYFQHRGRSHWKIVYRIELDPLFQKLILDAGMKKTESSYCWDKTGSRKSGE